MLLPTECPRVGSAVSGMVEATVLPQAGAKGDGMPQTDPEGAVSSTGSAARDGLPDYAAAPQSDGLPDIPAHGGQVRAVMQHFPTAPRPFFDLSTGISPFAYPFAVPEAAAFTRLPEEDEEADLRAAAAQAYGVADAAMVVSGAGSQSLIALLPFVLPAQRVCLLGPTYSGHRLAWQGQGIAVTQVDAPEHLHEAATQPGTVCVVCNPNNPDGREIPAAQLRLLADQCAQHGSLLVVDEAFADFGTQTVAPLLPHPALVVLRSFGKTYGLPGVRLGFLLAEPILAAQARAVLGSWPVGCVGLAAGRQALRDTAWLNHARQQAERAHARLTTLLRQAGLPCFGQASLFTLVTLPQAPALWRHLCQHGVVTRIFPDQPGRLRIGLPGTDDAWHRLENALRAWRDQQE